MSVVALASAKGSPGVTTAAVALAATWQHRSGVLVAELDPAGGDLAARFGLEPEPGLVTLAAAARRADRRVVVAEHRQSLPGGLSVLPGPSGAEQATAALATLGADFGAELDALDGLDVLADLGRLDLDGPGVALAARARLVLLIVRPVLADLQHLAHRLPAVQRACRDVAVVLSGVGPYPPREVAAALDAEVLGELPAEPRGAAVLGGRPAAPGVLRRAPLVRAAHELADMLATRLASDRTAAPAAGRGQP